MKIGNPCGFGSCLSGRCADCGWWKPCIYLGKSNKVFKLPKWLWLTNLLYKIEELHCK
jgi:hypothetical protein